MSELKKWRRSGLPRTLGVIPNVICLWYPIFFAIPIVINEVLKIPPFKVQQNYKNTIKYR